MGIKGCWTCRERKVRCDLRWPKCGNCTKAQRLCQGYGIQLSWPRNGNKKRAMTLQDTQHVLNVVPSNARRFLNASSWDISLSEELENERTPTFYLRTMSIPHPRHLSPAVLSREQSHLLEFFNESRSLILGPTAEEILAQFILRIALSYPSDTTNPVLQGVLALASLQLYGTPKSFHYKHLALSLVIDSTNWLDEKILLQALITMMLLYHYEIALESNSKGSWVTFFCAVKRILNTAPAAEKLNQQEYSTFLDWFYYHEVLAEFTVRHWKVPYEGCGFAPIVRSPRAIDGSGSKAEDNIGCPTDVLQLVAHTCRRALVMRNSGIEEANARLQDSIVLEEKISRAVGSYGPIPGQFATRRGRNTMVSDLHRLACLIYVNRAVHHVSGSEFHHRRLVREGILLLAEMITCQNAWPLFIIGCEAVDDDQRLAILAVFQQSREDRARRSSHVHLIQHMVEAVWKQRDLSVDNQVDYLTILDAVVGGLPFIPLFA